MLRMILHPEYYHDKHIHGPFHAGERSIATYRPDLDCNPPADERE